MLVLTRKIGERIRIGSNITLVITEVSRGKVTLGLEAPRSVVIMREELLAGRETPPGYEFHEDSENQAGQLNPA